jgi:hypothetical protein
MGDAIISVEELSKAFGQHGGDFLSAGSKTSGKGYNKIFHFILLPILPDNGSKILWYGHF